jgi:cobalt-zinc-cadmium resistance protein CzcA
MTKLIDLALDNKFLVILLALLLVGAGFWSVTKLPVDAVPDVTNVQVQVMTTAPALGPEEVEQFITVPVEASMSGVPKVTEIRSVSQFGLSVVTVVFEDGTDIYWARQQVGERLQVAKEDVPQGIPTPKMGPIASGLGEIYQFEVRSTDGKHSLMQLREILEWEIALPMRSVKGVVEVNALGGQVRTYEVQIDPNKLHAYKIPISKVFDAVRMNNANEGGGYVIFGTKEQRIVRGEGLVGTPEDLRNVVLDTRSDGTPVYLHQVAKVEFAPMVRQGAVTRDGRGEIVMGIVLLLAGENSREVVDRVNDKIDEIKKTLPEGVTIEPFYDRTELVRLTVHTLTKNLLEGGILVIVVLLILLGSFRAGLIVALAVPLSMLGAFVGMLYAGLSGNLISLGAIDFGLIVDGSVVLIENVVRRVAEWRHRNPGQKTPAEVIRAACHEVARPVAFGVGIILLVYLPILSLRGLEGKMFRPMAMTVIFALLTSLLLAFTLMPVLASIYLRTVSEHEPFLVRWAKRLYRPALRAAVAQPMLTTGVALGVFLASVFVVSQMGADFVPELDEGSVAIQALRLPSVSLEATVEETTKIEKCLLKFPEVESVVSKSGRPEIATDPMTINLTDINVSLKPRDTWRFGSKEVLVQAMEEALETEVPTNIYSFSQPIKLRVDELVAGVKSDIGISLYGDNLELLRQKAQEIAKAIGKVRGAADVSVEQTGGLPYLRVIVKRDAVARYGVNARDVLDAVAAVGGKVVGTVYEGQRRFPVQVRLGPDWRNELENIRQVKVADARGRPVPLEQLAELQLYDGPAQISREAVRRRTIVQCNVRGRDLASFVAEAREKVNRDVKLPSGYSVTWGGQFKNLQEATARLSVAVPAALALIFSLLYLTLHSVRLSLLIFLNVPMAATGGIIALALRGLPLSITAGVGFIALFGVAVLNGLVLVTYIRQLRAEGLDPVAAASEGAMSRLRPVLMTALVAMLGFIPMALSTGSGAEVQRPLATVVIGGLVTSTLLTLFVLPAAFPWFEGRDNAILPHD